MRAFFFVLTVASVACGEVCPAERELATDAYASLRRCSEDADCVYFATCSCATDIKVAVEQDHVDRMRRRWDGCCRTKELLWCEEGDGRSMCVDGLCALEEDGSWFEVQ